MTKFYIFMLLVLNINLLAKDGNTDTPNKVDKQYLKEVISYSIINDVKKPSYHVSYYLDSAYNFGEDYSSMTYQGHGSWKVEFKSVITYNEEEISYTKSRYYYDNHNPDQWTNTGNATYYYHESTGTWERTKVGEPTYDSITYKYDDKHRVILKEHRQFNSKNNRWENYRKYESVFDDKKNIERCRLYFQDTADYNEWLLIILITNHFDRNGNIIETLYQHIADSPTIEWDYMDRYLYTFDSHNNLTREVEITWDKYNSVWALKDKTEYIYDTNISLDDLNMPIYETLGRPEVFMKDKPLKVIEYFWDIDLDNWHANYEREYIYSDDDTGIEQQIVNDDIVLYPNPTADNLYIHSESLLHSTKYRIIDLLGCTLQEGLIQRNSVINVSNLCNGNYFIILENNDNTTSINQFIKK